MVIFVFINITYANHALLYLIKFTLNTGHETQAHKLPCVKGHNTILSMGKSNCFITVLYATFLYGNRENTNTFMQLTQALVNNYYKN